MLALRCRSAACRFAASGLQTEHDDFPVDRYLSLGLYMASSCRASAASGRRAGGQGGAPGGAAPYVTGRARCLAARGGYVNPASKGARWCPGASRRSTPSLGSRGTGKPRTLCAARMHRLGCLKFESGSILLSRARCSTKCCFAEPGSVIETPRCCYGPGSAAHRSARATRCAASGARAHAAVATTRLRPSCLAR